MSDIDNEIELLLERSKTQEELLEFKRAVINRQYEELSNARESRDDWILRYRDAQTEIARLRERIQMAEAERDAANSLAKTRHAEIERLQAAHDHQYNMAGLMLREAEKSQAEIKRLREENALLTKGWQPATPTALLDEVKRLRIAYDQEHQNCFNLTEKVIPNLKDDFKGIVYQLKVAALANDWDTFDDVVAEVLGYD